MECVYKGFRQFINIFISYCDYRNDGLKLRWIYGTGMRKNLKYCRYISRSFLSWTKRSSFLKSGFHLIIARIKSRSPKGSNPFTITYTFYVDSYLSLHYLPYKSTNADCNKISATSESVSSWILILRITLKTDWELFIRHVHQHGGRRCQQLNLYW